MSVQKYRVSKNEGNFTTFPNKVLQNLHNMEALGLYCFLHSLPGGWEFHKNHLRKHTKLGINKLNNLLKILEEYALIKIVQIRDSKGRFAHFDLQVNDGTAFVYKESTENCAPLNENRDTENRATENSTYKRKSVEKKESIKETSLNNSATDVTRESEPCAFNTFWDIYPVKKNKIRAKKIWDKKKLNKIAVLICNDVSNRQVNDSAWADEQYIPHPSTYLQNERWNDTVTTQPKYTSSKNKGGDALSRVLSKHLNKGNVYDHSTGNTIDPLRG
jgi:hypothetical protein